MKKIGLIPPHFIYFLKNEGIDIKEFKSSNFSIKDNYDKLIVKFPYGNTTLDIQVIFDAVDLLSPPDFVLLTDSDFYIDYSLIVRDWNFRESSSLYQSLYKIKQCYAEEQKKKLIKIIDTFKQTRKNVYPYIEQILSLITNSFSSYQNIPKSSQFVDIIIQYNNSFLIEEPSQIEISYPLDCLIRSREINRAPIFTLLFPLTSYFLINLSLPHFVSKSTINFSEQNCSLIDYRYTIETYENHIKNSFKFLKSREYIITKIIESNIGFPIEIETRSFLKFCLYFHNPPLIETLCKTVAVNNSNIKPGNAQSTGLDSNYLLYFNFNKEEPKFEFQIVDCDALKIIQRKHIEYGMSEMEINNTLNIILSSIVEMMIKRRKKMNRATE